MARGKLYISSAGFIFTLYSFYLATNNANRSGDACGNQMSTATVKAKGSQAIATAEWAATRTSRNDPTKIDASDRKHGKREITARAA